MVREVPSRGGRLDEVSWGFHGLLICSGVFLMPRWTMLEKVLGVAASWGRPYLVAKSSWGSVGTGWLAPYSDLWPTTVQTRGQDFLPGIVLSRRAGLGGDTLLGDTQPSTLDACGGVDCLDTCIIDFYIERMAFSRYAYLTLELLRRVCVYHWSSYHYRQ
jgi:hypothetical protein